MSDAELKARLRHEENKRGWVEGDDPLSKPFSASEIVELAQKLKERGSRNRKLLRRQRVHNLMVEWGAGKSGGSVRGALARIVDCEGDVFAGEGYDNTLSDWQADIYAIDTCVTHLSPRDQELIEYEYISYPEDRARYWCLSHEVKAERYDERLRELLEDLRKYLK